MIWLNSFLLALVLLFCKSSFAVDWSSFSKQDLEENYSVAQQRYSVMKEYYEFLYGKEKSISDYEIKKNAWSIGFKLHRLESYIKNYFNKSTFKNESIDAEKCVGLWSSPVEVLRLSVNYFKDWNRMSNSSPETIFRKLQVDLLLNYINAALLRQFSANAELGKTPLTESLLYCNFKSRNEILSVLLNLQKEASELYINAHGLKGLRNLDEDLVKASQSSVKHYERQTYLVVPKLIVNSAVPLFAQFKLARLAYSVSSLSYKTLYFGINAALGAYSADGLMKQFGKEPNELMPLGLMDLIKVKDLFISGDLDRFLDLIDIHREINQATQSSLPKVNYEYHQKFPFIKRGLRIHQTEKLYLEYLKKINQEIELEFKNRGAHL